MPAATNEMAMRNIVSLWAKIHPRFFFLMQTITMPVDTPTCCEFGGPNLDILYVTSGTLRRSEAELAGQTAPGGLFAVYTGVKGLALPPFAG